MFQIIVTEITFMALSKENQISSVLEQMARQSTGQRRFITKPRWGA